MATSKLTQTFILGLAVLTLVMSSVWAQGVIEPLPANGNIFISDSGIGGIVELDSNTYSVIGVHMNIPTGDLQFSPSNTLYVNNSDNRYSIHSDFTYHTYNTNEQPRTGSWVMRNDRTLITTTMGGAEVNGGIINIFDANNDGYANGYSEAGRYIPASSVYTLAFKGQDYSKVYFVQENTGIMYQADWSLNATSTIFAMNSLLQNAEFLSYHPNGSFYALKDNNILKISGDGSSVTQLFASSASPLSDPVQMIIGHDGWLYVADNVEDNLFRIAADGSSSAALLPEGLFTNLRGVAIAVPEPLTIGLLGIGGLTLIRRKRIARKLLLALLICVCFYGTNTAMAQPAVTDGPIVNPANGHSYYLLEASTWTEAETAAVSLGGHLATIRNQAEDTWIYDTFNYVDSGDVGRGGLWIGLNDVDIEGNFVWTSGEITSYFNWAASQPDNTGGENYVLIWEKSGEEGMWNDTRDDNWADMHNYPTYGVVEVVPEPATMGLLAIGGLGLIRRKRKQNKIHAGW